ncbi:MAG: type 4a pilus biogenesis protein PilO [Deferribacteres bacterium]|nr:type 4a pilus biogenesis protein PilO [candidate division KSB1 bacterium]MCB9503109.1 type 4a pilus biogenesis protein PilO [Deferribacteres bacterium]
MNWQLIKQIIESYRWRVYGVAFFILIIFAIVDYVVPASQSVYEMYDEIEKGRVQIANVEDWQTQKVILLKHIKNLRSEVDTIMFNQSQERHVSDIVGLFDKYAREEKLKITSIKPESMVDIKHAFELPMRVNLKGGYHGISRFINHLEETGLIIKVKGVQIYSDKLMAKNIEAELNLGFFYLKNHK